MEPGSIQLFYKPEDRLRMTCGDRSWHTVRPTWGFPLSAPRTYLGLLDAKDQEITTIFSLDDLTPESRTAVEEELRRRYLTSLVLSVVEARGEWGTTYWTVMTDRGEREFVTQSLQENAQWLGDGHILLTDVDGNRFELKDVSKLDARSQAIIGSIL